MLEQYSFIYFGYVKEKYIELLYEKKKKKKMILENLGHHTYCVVSHSFLIIGLGSQTVI